MEKKIVCEFTKRELEALYTFLIYGNIPSSMMPDWSYAKAEIKRKLNPHDPTIHGTSSWPTK